MMKRSLAKRWSWAALGVGGLAALALAGLGLTRNDPVGPAGAIVVIGGDHKPERVQRAAELYRAGYAPLVILSAGNLVQEGPEWIPEAEVLLRLALWAGLPAEVLLMEEQSQSTFQNAYFTQKMLAPLGIREVLLVASTYHSRRAGRIFEEVYGAAITVRVQAAPAGACAACWWWQPDQMGVVAYEYYNWGRYWLGWRLANEQPAGGGWDEPRR